MGKYVMMAAVVAGGLGMAGEANAGIYLRVGPVAMAAGKPYYATRGVAYRGGYYYAGRDHHHWSYRVWDAKYGRYHYYDPYLRIYYYWSPERLGYYPVEVAPAPVATVPAPAPVVVAPPAPIVTVPVPPAVIRVR